MSVLTEAHASADTNNQLAYVTPSHAIDADALPVVYVAAFGTVDQTPTLVQTVSGLEFELFEAGIWSTHTLFGFVGEELADGSTDTLTFTLPADASSGVIWRVLEASAMSRVGLDAVRQSGQQMQALTVQTPTVPLDVAALTENPLALALVKTSGTVATLPAGFGNGGEQALATPTGSMGNGRANSGITASSIVWGATVASVYGAMAVELDTSVPAPPAAEGWPGAVLLEDELTLDVAEGV